MPVKIHNKDYYTVAERLAHLNEETAGEYSLTTEMTYFKDGIVVFKATLTINKYIDGIISTRTYTGHAMEKEGSSTINKTSFVENAETSAIGRSLASASVLLEESGQFASADEVANALKNQVEIDENYIPFKKGANKGKKMSEIDVMSLEWILHESGMSKEVKDLADGLLQNKYVEENHPDSIEEAPEKQDNEELPF